MDIVLDPANLRDQLAHDVRTGLARRPKTLPPKYFYDARGSNLFDDITRLEEYYPTRAEREILHRRAPEIAALTQAETLIELGSGTSEKTRLLLDALTAAGTLARFVPVDVDAQILETAAADLSEEFPGVEIAPVVGDFEQHLDLLPGGRRRLVAFLGSTIGNFVPRQRAAFLAAIRAVLGDGDMLLLGTDLVKSPDRMVAAYDDAAGVTAAFNKNALAVMNRELGADFDPDCFEHVAQWNSDDQWIEMRLRSRRRQTVHIASLDLTVEFGAGEDLRTETSAKFDRNGIETEMSEFGLRTTHWWTDSNADFAVSLSVPD